MASHVTVSSLWLCMVSVFISKQFPIGTSVAEVLKHLSAQWCFRYGCFLSATDNAMKMCTKLKTSLLKQKNFFTAASKWEVAIAAQHIWGWFLAWLILYRDRLRLRTDGVWEDLYDARNKWFTRNHSNVHRRHLQHRRKRKAIYNWNLHIAINPEYSWTRHSLFSFLF